jgi:hypothetical protein
MDAARTVPAGAELVTGGHASAGGIRADERPWRYAPVQCARCGAVVEVAKFSPQHTSVQWTSQAVLRCAEFAAVLAAGRPSALIATCASLRASIDQAVGAGRVEILPP